MCFARTCPVFEEIDVHIRGTIPFLEYQRGCHLISIAAVRMLKKRDISAEIRLVGCWKPSMSCWIPHYIVVTKDGQTLDFKRRLFGKYVAGELVQAAPDIKPEVQLDGFYPTGKKYDMKPTLKLFEAHYRREYIKFVQAAREGPEGLLGESKVVQKCVDAF